MKVARQNVAALICGLIFIVATHTATGESALIGAAPKGDATAVASRIIKSNFPQCKSVSHAIRASDGSIRARCDDNDYMVFTLFNAKEGKLHELALNCTAAKNLLNISC